jgi:predicted hotdog family 3-hydroxylacyl-ACP dehydratase
MNGIIEKNEIERLIPHAGTMCLLDRVVDWDDKSITCLSETHRSDDNPLRRDGQLSALHALEYGAQAAAVHGGLRARVVGTSAPPGYLAALRDAHLRVSRLDDLDSPLRVRAHRLFGETVNSVYECEICAGYVSVANGRITIVLAS